MGRAIHSDRKPLLNALSVSTSCLLCNDRCKSFKSVKDVLNQLKNYLKAEVYEFQVRRGHVLEDLLRETRQMSFNPFRRVKVCSYKSLNCVTCLVMAVYLLLILCRHGSLETG